MANTYINIILHLVFAVKNRECLISDRNLSDFHSYIAGSFSNRGHRVIEIGGTSNHVHVLFNYNPKELISDLVREIKSSASMFVKEKHLSTFKFNWQRGYGCFSVDSGSYEKVCEYIRNQESHHRSYPIREELRRLLVRCGMAYNEDYLFDDV